MISSKQTTVYLKDYAPPAYLIPHIDLRIDLVSESEARVTATLDVRRNPAVAQRPEDLVLDAEDLFVESMAIDGRPLGDGEWTVLEDRLRVANVPDTFILGTTCRINPKANTTLMGLYTSKTGFFTLCEAEGFRRITPFLDRPDVMSRYMVSLHADRERCPVLLSNGNLIASGEEPGGRHWVRWEDPFPKPSYLFAVVAGRLDRIEERFVTRSGRTVRLQFFAEPGKLDQAIWALASLKHAMAWDEEKYGLEIDLDEFNIVAVEDFNAGAMENKGLNVFNTKLVLARTDISTDFDFKFVDRTVAHEYFHNWTGNRVTCRDWFQLSLKEGLTVFREQQYAADRYSSAVERIQTVRNLRSYQFPEDAGPMAHPVRPQSYQKVSNFYTNTVYSKGAEVVRMIHTLIGAASFRKGIDLYFERHDGQAVTTDDFVAAMESAAGVDLGQFRLWYEQSGTPRVTVTDEHDPASGRYELRIEQSCPPTSGQPEKRPFQIPIEIGLLDRQGRSLPLRLEGEAEAAPSSRVLLVSEATQVFRFEGIPERPVPSLLRNFSAPVILDYAYSDGDLALLLASDTDPFNRWEAGQRLALKLLLAGITDRLGGRELRFPEAFAEAMARVLDDAGSDPAFAAEALALPPEIYVGEQMVEIDPAVIHEVRQAMRHFLATRLEAAMRRAYREFYTPGPFSPDATAAGKRGLRNICLSYLMELSDEASRRLCVAQLDGADNMTDALSALISLANCDCPERSDALAAFFAKWQDEPMVVDKWLSVQAGSRLSGTVDVVRKLTRQPVFDLRNPNKVYALIGSFAGNQLNFHSPDATGYDLVAEQVEALDRVNPQVAARIARNFERWRRFEPGRRALMKQALERLAKLPGLSKETGEVVAKALA